MHPIEAFVRHPVKVSVGVLLVALFGAISLVLMPMQLTPEVQTPTITVETQWRGASPQEVEREIVQPQEEQLQSVEGLVKMWSESMDSMGRITLEFRVGLNMEEALLKVNSRLQQVSEYPLDADEPVLSTANSSDRPIAWFILSPRVPGRAELDEFARQHPRLAEVLRPVRAATTPALALLRLRELAGHHPEVAGLLPREIDVTTLRKFAEDYLETRLERVEGVANSNVFGGRDPELQVVIDPQALAARQLTIGDLRRVLRGQNTDTSGGDFWEGKRRYVVRTLGRFRTPQQVEQQVLAVRDGAPVYVRDVAEVREGFKKPDGVVRRFGMASIAVNAQRETGANVLEVMKGLQVAVAELNAQLLDARGLQLTQVYDETEYIYSAIGLVNQNIVVGGLLTVIVLLLFLRSGRSTLIIGLAIPTSIVGTFLCLHLMGRSLNVISLAGLAFAVGMLVDNAIVVLENIYRHYQLGHPPREAAVTGTREVWGAVVASTLTTLAVFLPVLYVQEEAGQLFRDIALAISSAVGLSLVVSVIVIPTTAARLLRRHPAAAAPLARRPAVRRWSEDGNGQESPAERGTAGAHTPSADRRPSYLVRGLKWLDVGGGQLTRAILALNAFALRGVLRRVALVGLLVTASLGITYLLWPKVEYLPAGNRNLVFGIMLPPPGYNLDQLVQLGQIVEDDLRPYWDVDPERLAAEEKKGLFPAIADFFYVARGRQVFFGLRAMDPLRAGELVPLIQTVREKIPGAIVVANQSSLFEQGLAAGRTIDIQISGPDLIRLVQLGGKILGGQTRGPGPGSGPQPAGAPAEGDPPLGDFPPICAVVPGAQARPIPSLDLSSPELHVEPRPIPAAEMGVSAEDLGYTVDALVDGAYATDYFVDGDKIDLTIRGRDSFVARTQDVRLLPVATPAGLLVPLESLATVRLDSGPEQIDRRERQRSITIQVTPPSAMPLEEALDRIQQQVVDRLQTEGDLAGGYVIYLSGTADKLRDTWRALRWNIVLALLITYLLMAALFESWLYPLVVIFSVPLGAVGGVAGLRLLSWYVQAHGQPPQTLDVLTMLGFVILIGTVVNNAILIVHQALNHIRDDGLPPREAILESLRTRVRPIFMTTATTVFGLLPLVLFPGAGSELYRGLGSVVLGGLLVSTVFTLVLTPTLFSLVMDARDWLLGTRRTDRPGRPTPAEPGPPQASHTLLDRPGVSRT